MQGIIRLYSSHPIRPSSLILCRLRPNVSHLTTKTQNAACNHHIHLYSRALFQPSRAITVAQIDSIPHCAWSKSRRLLLLRWCLSRTAGLQNVGVTRSVIALSSFFLSTHVGVLNPRVGKNLIHSSTTAWVEVEHTANDVPSITWQ